MHELSLAQNLIELVVEEATRHDMAEVTQVTLTCGTLRAVVPELMQSCFGIVAAETIAAKATLTVRRVAAEAMCEACGATFSVEDILIVCPRCDATRCRITAGNELALTDIEGE